MKILVCDPISEKGVEALKGLKGSTVDVKLKLPKEEIIRIIPEYNAVVVRSETKITADIIEAGKNLKVIGRAGVGIDNVDVESATKRGIIVMNTPAGNTISAAEHTVSLILALSRNIPQASASMKANKWERSKFMGVELYGKTLGVVGLGKIGLEVVNRMKSFGMKIIAYDPFISEDKAKELEVELKMLNELIKNSDYMTFHTPLTKETKHMIAKKQFDMMKKGVRIVNVARGGIIDESALYDAVVEGKVAGAALDVFEVEPPKDSKLTELDNVVMTPHLGASTKEAQENVAIEIAHQIVEALQGGMIKNAVNFPSIEPELYEQLSPYIELSEKIGKMYSQLHEGRIASVEITYSGDVAGKNVFPMTSALVKGLLEPVVQESVNYVNAIVLAKSRGIHIVEKKTGDIADYVNLISLNVKSDGRESVISATLFSRKEARIVRIDNFRINSIPSGNMLIVYNTDVPGVLGHIATALGKRNVNIAGLQYGRIKSGGDAISVLNVDSSLDSTTIEEIKKLPDIKDAKMVVL